LNSLSSLNVKCISWNVKTCLIYNW